MFSRTPVAPPTPSRTPPRVETKEPLKTLPPLEDGLYEEVVANPLVYLTPDTVPERPDRLRAITVVRDDSFKTILSSMRSSSSKPVEVVFGTSVSLPASGSGFVNAVLAVNLVAGLSEFSSYAALYGEFFVQRVDVMYQPQSMYGMWPAAAQAATGQPLGIVALHHGITAATTIALQSANASLKYAHTSQPWKFSWLNIESSKDKTVISPVSGVATATQGWALSDSTSAGGYTGQIHFLSPVTLGTAAAQPLGNFLMKFKVLFRNRQ